MTDLDGTLIDTVRVNYLAYKEALEPFGVKIDYDYFKKFCNGRHYKAFVSEIFCLKSIDARRIYTGNIFITQK